MQFEIGMQQQTQKKDIREDVLFEYSVERLFGVDGDECTLPQLAIEILDLFFLERHDTIDHGVEAVVLGQLHIHTRMKLGAVLTHDDLALGGDLTSVFFDAQSLTCTVATVFGLAG